MGFFLNRGNNGFVKSLNSEIYVDKTDLINECNKVFNSNNYYMCVTRPRRFGKSMTLSMLNAYYSKGCNSKDLFNGLNIEKYESFLKHLNKHNVIWIDMSRIYTDIKDKNQFIDTLINNILSDFKEVYKDISFEGLTLAQTIIKINSQTGERFIFLIDEWDIIFREQEYNKKLCNEYIEFLRNLFKSGDVSDCIELVYMTGILPIKRYSTQSTLNKFKEYNMISPKRFERYIGFTQEEVNLLCLKYNRDFEKIKNWYNGYKIKGIEIYNPCSVVEAVITGRCEDYWTQTSATEAIVKYLKYKKGNLKKILATLITGEKAEVDVSMFANDLTKIYNSDSALTVLIHLGYLAYEETTKSCYIPNYEILKEFERAIKIIDWKEYTNPISNSKELYNETLKGNTDYINKSFNYVHQIFSTMFDKNTESVLQMIVHLSYFDCRDYYFIFREPSVSTGRADVVFVPRDSMHIPLIVELKVKGNPDTAIDQIKENKYVNIFDGYHGKILFVGIVYDSKKLEHDSKVLYVEI